MAGRDSRAGNPESRRRLGREGLDRNGRIGRGGGAPRRSPTGKPRLRAEDGGDLDGDSLRRQACGRGGSGWRGRRNGSCSGGCAGGRPSGEGAELGAADDCPRPHEGRPLRDHPLYRLRVERVEDAAQGFEELDSGRPGSGVRGCGRRAGAVDAERNRGQRSCCGVGQTRLAARVGQEIG